MARIRRRNLGAARRLESEKRGGVKWERRSQRRKGKGKKQRRRFDGEREREGITITKWPLYVGGDPENARGGGFEGK